MNENDMIHKLRKLHADGELSDEELKRLEGAVLRDSEAQWGTSGSQSDSGPTANSASGEDLIQKLARRRDEGALTDADFAEMQEVVRRDATAWRDESAQRKPKAGSKKRPNWKLVFITAAMGVFGLWAGNRRQAEWNRKLQEENQRRLEDFGRRNRETAGTWREWKTADGKIMRSRIMTEAPRPSQQPPGIRLVPQGGPATAPPRVSIDPVTGKLTPEGPASTTPPRGTGAPWEEPPSATRTLLPWEQLEQPTKAGKPIAGTAAAKPAAPQLGKEESKKFLGTWQCVSRIDNGKKETEGDVKKLTWVLGAGGQFKVLKEGKLVAEGVQTDVDPAKTPKTLNQLVTEGEGAVDVDKDAEVSKYDGKAVPRVHVGNLHTGIYRFDGDTVEVCIAPADRGRPTEFASQPGSGQVCAVWKRVAGAKDVEAESPAAKRPSAQRVAHRAMVLALMIYRSSIERFPGEAKFEALHARLPAWVDQLGLASELEKEEHDFLRVPLGKADAKVVLNSEWRVEGLGVLAWALKRYEMPPYDELTSPRKTVGSVGLSDELLAAADTAAAKKLFRDAELRPASEIDRFASHITIVNWRLRTYRIAGLAGGPENISKRMDFVGYLRAHPSFKESWLKGLRLVGKDLSVGDKAIGDAPPDEVRQCGSIAVERQIAAYWLQGDEQVYSKVDAPTILLGLE